MNTKQKLHQASLTKWTAIFKEQADSGLTVKQFCSYRDLSPIHINLSRQSILSIINLFVEYLFSRTRLFDKSSIL